MSKTKEELEKEIIQFLDEGSTKMGDVNAKCALKHGIACVLATSRNNIPRATPVDFFNEGLSIGIGAEPGGKLLNLKENPNVSIGIYRPVDHSVVNKSIQYFGKASLINMDNNSELYVSKMKKWGMYDTLSNMVRERLKQGIIQKGTEEEAIQKYLRAFNLIGKEFKVKYVKPCLGAKIAKALEADTYYRVESNK